MSSSRKHFGKVIPICRRCESEADSVAVFPSGETFVGCHPCVNAALGQRGREYPLETYYAPGNRECLSFSPDGANEYDLYDPDDETQRSWISADNETERQSSVQLTEIR